jgi:RNA polymerase sigma-70 factor (ECF subfamily)
MLILDSLTEDAVQANTLHLTVPCVERLSSGLQSLRRRRTRQADYNQQNEPSFESYSENLETVKFEELAIPLLHALYNFARWLVRNQHDAEDLVQDTYLKALRSFSSFEPGTNFRAWMFKILKNTFLTSCSKQENRRTVSIDIEASSKLHPASYVTPESVLIEHFDNEALQTAIEQLSIIHREVILLSDVEEVSYQDMAEILSIPIGTVMSRLARGRKALSESLGRSCL